MQPVADTLNAFLEIVEDAVPVALCRSLMAGVDALPTPPRIEEHWRRCACVPVGSLGGGALLRPVVDVIAKHFLPYRDRVDSGGVLNFCSQVETPNVLRYDVATDTTKPEHFAEHSDAWDRLTATRQVSVLLYLNDVDAGGDTVFPRIRRRVSPKAGRLVLFPSSFLFNHRADPVFLGSKYVVVTWLHFPDGPQPTVPLIV